MRRKSLTFLLGAVVATGLLAPTAHARDLVRAAAQVALADDPPPTVSEKRAREQREAEARARVGEKKHESSEEAPYYKKWWFWALTAVVVGGTVALGVWAIQPSTVPAKACTPGVIGCFGDGRSGIR